jgi:Phage integrase, N-terminal SAM-like domain
MTPLRRRMIEDMQVRNLAPRTQISYIEQVDRFARHFRKSPVHLGKAEIRAWQLYLAQVSAWQPVRSRSRSPRFGSCTPLRSAGNGPSRMTSRPAGSRTRFPRC